MKNMTEIKYKKLTPNAKAPVMAHEGDACYDVCATGFKQEGGVIVVSTGLAFAIPPGYEIQVRSRSGLGSKGIFVTNGVGTIDSGYRGEAKIFLSSVGGNAFLSDFDKVLNIANVKLQVGDRVAQFAVREVPPSVMMEVEDLDETERGTGGFGSTGLSQLPETKQKEPKSKG